MPTITNRKDVSNFEGQFTAEAPKFTPPQDPTVLTREEQEMFEGFDMLYTLRESYASGSESGASE